MSLCSCCRKIDAFAAICALSQQPAVLDRGTAASSRGQPPLCSDLHAQQNPCDDIWHMGLKSACPPSLRSCSNAPRAAGVSCLGKLDGCIPAHVGDTVVSAKACSTNLAVGCSFCGHGLAFHGIPAGAGRDPEPSCGPWGRTTAGCRDASAGPRGTYGWMRPLLLLTSFGLGCYCSPN